MWKVQGKYMLQIQGFLLLHACLKVNPEAKYNFKDSFRIYILQIQYPQ